MITKTVTLSGSYNSNVTYSTATSSADWPSEFAAVKHDIQTRLWNMPPISWTDPATGNPDPNASNQSALNAVVQQLPTFFDSMTQELARRDQQIELLGQEIDQLNSALRDLAMKVEFLSAMGNNETFGMF